MTRVFFLVLAGGVGASSGPACYVDTVAHRQLTHQICEVTGLCEDLTVRVCAQECRRGGFALAGVEAGHQCACGNALTNASAVAPMAECDTKCTGNASETCGGSFRVMAYAVAGVPAPPPPAADPVSDARWIPNGRTLRDGGYSCQPSPSGALSPRPRRGGRPKIGTARCCRAARGAA